MSARRSIFTAAFFALLTLSLQASVHAGVISSTLTQSLYLAGSIDPDRVLFTEQAILTEGDEVDNLGNITSYFSVSLDLANNILSIKLSDPTAPVQTDFARIVIMVGNPPDSTLTFDVPNQFVASVVRMTDDTDLINPFDTELTETIAIAPNGDAFSITLDLSPQLGFPSGNFLTNATASYQFTLDVPAGPNNTVVPEPTSLVVFGASGLALLLRARSSKRFKLV